MNPQLARVAAVVSLSLATAVCAQQPAAPAAAAPPAGAPWRVIDTFEVGPTIYARTDARACPWRDVGRHVRRRARGRPGQISSRAIPSRARKVWPTSTCFGGHRPHRATSGSAPMPAAYRATRTASGRPTSRCTAWLTTGSIRSQRQGRHAVDRHLGRGQQGRSEDGQVHHLRQAADQRVGLRPGRRREGPGLGSAPKAACRCTTARTGRPGRTRTVSERATTRSCRSAPTPASAHVTRHDLTTRSRGSTYNPNYVFSIHVAPDDSVWAGTWGGGVSRFDGKGWHNLTSKEGLVGNIVYSIAQSSMAPVVRHQQRRVALRRQDLADHHSPERPARGQRLRTGGRAQRRSLGRHAPRRDAHRTLDRPADHR